MKIDVGIRFASEVERARFCVETGHYDLIEQDVEIPPDIVEQFFAEREKTITPLRDFRKRQRTKKGWRTKRFSYLKGIKKFHHSLAGKKMHRSVGRKLSQTITKGRSTTAGRATKDRTRSERMAWCKALSSIRTHCFILAENYMPVSDMVDVEEALAYLMPIMQRLEHSAFAQEYEPWNRDMVEVLLRITDWGQIRKELREANTDCDWDKAWPREGAAMKQIQSLQETPLENTYAATDLLSNIVKSALAVDLSAVGLWDGEDPEFLFDS